MMTFDMSRLKGKIAEVCGTRREFAKRVGVSETTISYKMTGKSELTASEIVKWASVLEILPEEIADYFFA